MDSPRAPSQAQFDAARLGVYDAIEEHNFSRRQRRFLKFLLFCTFARRQTRVFIRNLNNFVQGTGLHKSHVSKVIQELKAFSVIDVTPWPPPKGREFAACYGFNILFFNWNAPPDKGRSFTEQLLLEIEEPPELRDLLRQNFVEVGNRLAVSPTDDRGVSAAVSLGQTGPAPITLAREGGESAAPQPGGPPAEPGSGYAPRLQGPGVSGPGVTEKVTVGLGASEPSVTGSPPGGVTEKVTVTVSARKNAAADGVTEKVTVAETVTGSKAAPPHTPLVQRTKEQGNILSEEQPKGGILEEQRARARGGVTEKVTVRRITWAEQRRLEELISSWVGPEDMQRSAKVWVDRAIRNFPEAAEESVKAARQQLATRPDYFNDQAHRIKWLMTDMARQAGVKSWGDVRPGPEPI